MKRRLRAILAGSIAALVVIAVLVPSFVYALSHTARSVWTTRTWIVVLSPNVLIVVVVALVAAAAYLLATRKRSR